MIPTYYDIFAPLLQDGYQTGLCLILGPTGNGKTSALYKDHRGGKDFVLNLVRSLGKQAIFTTHRKNIIKDVLKGCKEAGINCVHLKSNEDIIKGIIEAKRVQKTLADLSALNFFAYTVVWSSGRPKRVDENSISKQFRRIEDRMSIAKSAKEWTAVREDCGDLLGIFRNALKSMSEKLSTQRYEKVLDNKVVQEFFPFIAFERDKSNTLLVATIQKLGFGFFNGRRNLSMHNLRGYIFFLDEFDYLPTAMLDQLIDSRRNKRPLNFVSLFCEFFAGKNHRDELIRKAIDIAEEFGLTLNNAGIAFPRGNVEKYKFSNADGLFNRQDGSNFGYIFDGGYTVSSRPFYLRDHQESVAEQSLVFTANDNCLSVLSFNQLIKRTENGICNYFNSLKDRLTREEQRPGREGESGNSISYYDSLINKIYNENNDGRRTEYHKFIEAKHFFNKASISDEFRELLDIVRTGQVAPKSLSKEQLLEELSLPTDVETVEFPNVEVEITLRQDHHQKLLVYRTKVRAKWKLPHPNTLSGDWETFLFAETGDVVLSFSTGVHDAFINNTLATFTVHKGMVVELRQSVTARNSFQVVKRYPQMRLLECDDRFYTDGFNYYQIVDAADPYDHNLVYMNHYHLPVTPEAKLFLVASQNLVFGLSATADIERHWGSFSLNWVRHALQIFKQACDKQGEKTKVYIDHDFGQHDKLIAAMLDEKDAHRHTQLLGDVRKASLLNGQDEWSKRMSEGLDYLGGNDIYLYGTEETSEEKRKRRKERVSRHIEMIRWILEDSQRDFHLVFTDTHKNTLRIFEVLAKINLATDTQDNYDIPNGFKSFLCHLNYKGKDGQIMTALVVKPFQILNFTDANGNISSPPATIPETLAELKSVFEVTLNRDGLEKSGYLIFANADTLDKLIENRDSYNSLFNQGWREQKKVILITQHASAANGINLQFALDSEDGKPLAREKDFEGIHILDPQYYYFAAGQRDDDTDEDNDPDLDDAEKEKAIYLASKLKIANVITTARLKRFIGEFDFGAMNLDYQRTSDYRCDLFALFSQEIGRVERTRTQARATEVSIHPKIWSEIETLLSDHFLGEVIYTQRQGRISTLLNAILNNIESQARQKRFLNANQGEPLNGIATRYEKAMKELTKRQLPALRRGDLSSAEATQVRTLWGDLRTAALQGDYQFSANGFDFKKLCVIRTKHLHPEDSGEAVMFIKDDTVLPHWESGCKPYRPHQNYKVVKGNAVISNYFIRRNFMTNPSYTNQGYNTLFIPAFQQAIVKGAIGEEGIKALLLEEKLPIEENDEIPDALFELFDFKIKGIPIYIDAKNWDESIIRNFANEKTDGEVVKKLNHPEYVKKGMDTWRAIKKFPGNDHAKLIYINLLFEGGHYYTQQIYYFAEDYQRVYHYQEATFVYLAGALDSKNRRHPMFDELISHIETDLRETL